MSIKNIKEKQLLVNLAKQLGEQPDPKLIEEIESYNKLQNSIRSSIRENFEKDFGFAIEKVGKIPEPKVVETTFSELDDLVNDAIQLTEKFAFPTPPSIDDLEKYLQEEKTDELVQEKTEIEGTAETNTASEQSNSTENNEGNEREGESIREEKLEELTSLVDLASKFISDKASDTEKDIKDPRMLEMNALQLKVKYLEQWISRIAATGPGGGEVNLLKLDDVDTSNKGYNKYLKYDPSTKKMVFDTPAGGSAYVTTDDNAPATPVDGMLWYNTLDARMYIWLEESGSGQWVDIGDGNGPSSIKTTSVTTNTYTVIDTDQYIGVNVAAAVSITIPTSTTTGRTIIIKDESGNCATNPITLLGTIDNDAAGAVLQINNGALQLVYQSGWRIV